MSGKDNSGFSMGDPPPTTSAGSTRAPDSAPPLTTTPSGNINPEWDQPPSNVKVSTIEPLDNLKPDLLKSDAESGSLKPQRAMWDNQIEFLMSCIATSVGLGNVWRFPFVAYKNGGGAFLIPYIIVLFLVGKPMYYLECIVGQFSSRNSVTVWALSPALKGVGYAQTLVCSFIVTYYVSIVALCLFYLAMSFQAELPWAVCDPSWENCVPSNPDNNMIVTNDSISSAELYFVKTVLQQNDGLEYGLGTPIWYLCLCLLASWVIVFVIVARGVKSSGKAAYFLAIFPYVVMLILLITTLLLEGAGNGILFFITPQWDKLLKLDVWYAAVTQVFYSLSVCTGAIIMFSSYNGFKQNIYRDAMIVTTLDTFTSLLSGITIFGILGNLAFELNQEVDEVVGSGGTGLAFISYPDAIAKTFLPQLFSVLFFLMMVVLGIGSAVALLSTINTVLLDAFPRVPTVYISAICCSSGFGLGIIYCTPGGQYVLELVDHYGGTFLVLFCAISELIAICWIYGLESLCLDIEFMLGIKTSFYWRFCWGIITPALMLTVFVYGFVSYEELKFGEDYVYPAAANAAGYTLLGLGIVIVPTVMCIVLWKNRKNDILEIIYKSFGYSPSWGPRSALEKQEWQKFREDAKVNQMGTTFWRHMWNILTGAYRSSK